MVMVELVEEKIKTKPSKVKKERLKKSTFLISFLK